MPQIITRVLSGKSANRADYIARTNLDQALEGSSRPAFTPLESGFKSRRAASAASDSCFVYE